VADTRVIKPSDSGGRIITDSAAKIFGLKVQCTNVSRDNIPDGVTYFIRDFGIAYAGNSLPALMTITSANTLLQQLMSPDTSSPVPSLGEIGELVRKLAERFLNEALLALHNSTSLFEAVLFGCCPRSNGMEVYRIYSGLVEGSLSVALIREGDENAITLLGSGKLEFSDKLARIKEQGEWKSRLPKHAVREMVKSGVGIEVGGYISQALADRNNFRIYTSYEPIVWGTSPGWRHYNGIDLDEIGMIGPCMIGGVGMAG
jgi:hypothetical protein